jgi:DNA-binding NtrC family response regulator
MAVLIIDAAAFQRNILTMLLESEGRLDVRAYSIVEDLPSPPDAEDILFVDAAQCAHVPAAWGARVVATAPERNDERLAEAVSAGALALLSKPFTPEGLRVALRDIELWKGTAA